MNSSFKEGCAYLEFGSAKANSFSRAMLTELASAIIAAQQANVILIKSSGDKSFSAGASFEEFKAIKDKSEAINYFSGF